MTIFLCIFYFYFFGLLWIFFGLDLRALVELCIPNIKKLKRFLFFFLNFVFSLKSFWFKKNIWFYNFYFFLNFLKLFYIFWIFGVLYGFFWIFLDFFWDFFFKFILFWIYWIFLNFGDFWIFIFFWTFLIFFGCFVFFSKLLRLLINVMEVTTEPQKWVIIGRNTVKSSFFWPKGQEKPRLKPSAGAKSKPA